jgi:hypothetical protein
MSIQLNHTIVYARDKQISAQFLADILGTSISPPGRPRPRLLTRSAVHDAVLALL